MKQKTYYILAINYGDGYGVEFGSYDKLEVVLEHQCNKQNYAFAKHRVIKTTDNQPAIDAAINKLNEVK